ncbi:hypothetical protein J6590_033929 [Homalodisca vitripennis]|nr:hypothetical protein J6590_033929 [Homalodisca vitripennis]
MSGRKALIPCKISGTNKTIRKTIRAGPSPGGDWQLADGRVKFAHPACNEPPHWSPGHAPFNAATLKYKHIEFVCILGRRSRYEHFSGSFARYEECSQVLTTATTGDVQDMNISQALLHGMKNVHKFSQQQQRSGILKYIWFVCILGRRSRYEHFSGSFTRYEECAQVLTTTTSSTGTLVEKVESMRILSFAPVMCRIFGCSTAPYFGIVSVNISVGVETMQGVRIELFRSSSPTSFEFLQMNMIPAEVKSATASDFGCCTHSTINNIAFLQETFGNHLISLRTNFPYPAHSPDFTTPDAYIWGTLKENIFREEPPSTIV